MMSRNTRIFVLSGAVACALVSFADYPEDAILAVPYTQFPSSSAKYRDRDGNTTNWVDGSYMVLLHETNGKWPGTTRLDSWFNVRGLRFETHYDGEYFETGGGFRIGAAGLEMTVAGSNAAMGRNDVHKLAGRIKLMENQVWKGPASGNNAAFSFTCDNYTHSMSGGSMYNLHNDFLDADPSVTSWTVQDHLTVWFCHTNALQNVDVRVVDPARIRCRTKVFDSDSSSYYAGLHAKSLTLSGDAEMWQAGGKQTSYFKRYDSTMQPLMDSITMAPLVILENGADMKLVGAEWDLPLLRVTGAGATSSLRGSCMFLRASNAFEIQNGATLELAATNQERNVSASIDVTGTGIVRILPYEWDISGTLTLGADVDLEFSGPGLFPVPIVGGKSLVLNPGAGKDVVLTKSATSATFSTIEIRSGACTLPSMAAMPAAASFVVADGALLRFLSADGYDPSRVTLNGSGTCTFNNLVVTDETVADSEIVVNQDEVLQIYGDGLTAATRVTLAGGTLRFMRNGVTVASPVLVTDNSFIESIPAVTGTVAGVVASTNVASGPRSVAVPNSYGGTSTTTVNVRGLWVLGPGTTIFAGGGSFHTGYGDTITLTRGACAHFTGGVYRFEIQSTSSDYVPIYARELYGASMSMMMTGRHICVRDGGSLEFASAPGASVQPKILFTGPKDGGNYDATTLNPVFEISTGGTVTIPVNSTFCLGYTDNRVFLKITGGTLNLETTSSRLYFGGPGALTSCGEIYLESGTLKTSCALWRHTGSTGSTNRLARGHLVWTGGTLKLNSNFTDPAIFDMPSSCYGSSHYQMRMLRIAAQILGENCILDLTDLPGDSVANVPPGLDEAEWYGHGCLTVKGGKELVMNSVPDGFSLRIEGDGTRVTVPEAAYVYDYDTCLPYWNWKGYDKGKPYSVTNSALAALSVAAYTLAGTNCGFHVTRANLPVSVTNTTVSGEWNGAVALTAAGGLTAENLTFEDGALLSVPYAGGETVAFPLAGELTLPQTLDVRAAPAAGAALSGQNVFTAAEGATGSPVWNMQTGRFKIFADGSRVWVVPKGVVLSVR